MLTEAQKISIQNFLQKDFFDEPNAFGKPVVHTMAWDESEKSEFIEFDNTSGIRILVIVKVTEDITELPDSSDSDLRKAKEISKQNKCNFCVIMTVTFGSFGEIAKYNFRDL